MKIVTEIRHVTKAGVNLFLELGFTPDEAKRLQAASRKQIDPVNFLPRMKIPTLMVTGKYDTILPVELAQEPMFRKLGTATKDKRHEILPTGHALQGPEVRNQLAGRVLDWLDRYLGKP